MNKMFTKLYYELKYLAEKERNKNIYYREIVSKVELRSQLEEANRTIKHQKEIIKQLRADNKKDNRKEK